MRCYPLLLVAAVFLLTPRAALPADSTADWPAWRGAAGSGITTGTLPAPIDPESPRWRVDLPGESTSTPIVVGSRIFVTTQVGAAPLAAARTDDGGSTDAAPGDEQLRFFVLALDLASGNELWRFEMPSDGSLPPVHPKHNLASPSPVSDGERVVVWFGTGQLASLTVGGELEWQRHLGREIAPFDIRWAHGSSPVLYRDTVLLLCDHPPLSYLLALDKRTGEERWRTDRGEGKRSYSTPLIVPRGDGHAAIVSSNARIDAYDAATGRPLWHADGPVRVPVATPVWASGILYTSRGYRSGPYMAIRTGGSGDVTSSHTLWRVPTGAPYVASLLHHEGLLYLATENGILSAVGAEDGKTVWRTRLGGYFSASPLAVRDDENGDRILLANEEGELFVVRAGREFELLEKSEFPERILASPVIAGGRLLVRTDSKLYAF